MALVAYDNSDDSSLSDDDESDPELMKKASTIEVLQPVSESRPMSPEKLQDSKNEDPESLLIINTTLFSKLPPPMHRKPISTDVQPVKESEIEPSNSFVGTSKRPLETQKPKKAVKITIPSLNDLDDEEEDVKPKRFKPSISGSGLFKILPPPKKSLGKVNLATPKFVTKQEESSVEKPAVSTGLTSLVPLSVSRPKSKAINAAPNVTAGRTTKPITATQEQKVHTSNEEENEETTDFFNLDSSDKDLPMLETNDYAYDSVNQPKSVNAGFNTDANYGVDYVDYSGTMPVNHQDYSNSNLYVSEAADNYGVVNHQEYNTDVLSSDQIQTDENMLRLLGKRKGIKEDIVFVDVKQDDKLARPEEWMTKALTEEKPTHSFSRKGGEMPTTQQRRKHQITYLAFQAKERELDLKNQWAQNRMTKKQTQAKYGF